MTRIWNLGHQSYFGFCSGITEKPTFSALLASVTAVAALVAAGCHSFPGFPALRAHLSRAAVLLILLFYFSVFFSVFEYHLSVCILSRFIVESFVTKLSVNL